MTDPYNPPPGAQEWLASCIARSMEVLSGTNTDSRAFGLLGAIEGHAKLTPEQAAELNRWLFPALYDAEGNRKP